MKANNRNVNRAIKKATGFDVYLFKAEGCVSFHSDDEYSSDILSAMKSRTVYVNSIDQLSVEQWVAEFKWLLEQLPFEVQQ